MEKEKRKREGKESKKKKESSFQSRIYIHVKEIQYLKNVEQSAKYQRLSHLKERILVWWRASLVNNDQAR